MPLAVSAENFEEQVLRSSQPVLVDFWSASCVPCMRLIPAIEDMEARYGSRVRFVTVDAAQNRRLCMAQKVFSLPSMLFFVDGREVARRDGMSLQAKDVEEQVSALFAAASPSETDQP